MIKIYSVQLKHLSLRNEIYVLCTFKAFYTEYVVLPYIYSDVKRNRRFWILLCTLDNSNDNDNSNYYNIIIIIIIIITIIIIFIHIIDVVASPQFSGGTEGFIIITQDPSIRTNAQKDYFEKFSKVNDISSIVNIVSYIIGGVYQFSKH